MHGLYEMVAAPAPLVIDGDTYWLSPLRLAELGQAEQRILAGRPKPLDILPGRIEGLPEAIQLDLARQAFQTERVGERVSDEELDAWFRTRQGAVFKFWLMLQRKHSAITLDDAEKLIVAAGIEATLEAMQRAGGGQLGNLSRLRRIRARLRFPGAAFFANCLRRMAGRPTKSAS